MTNDAPRERPALPNEDGVVAVVCAVIVRNEKCLIGRRLPGGSSGGKWEFPGGKLELGETPEQALCREIEEELGTRIEVRNWLGRGSARTERRLIVLDAYRATLTDEVSPHESSAHAEICWVAAPQLSSREWAEADIPLVPLVLGLLAESNQK